MANSFDVGDCPRITGTFRDTAGAGVDPSTVSAEYRNPAGQVTTLVYNVDPRLQRTAAGVYSFTVLLDQPGVWFYRIEASGSHLTAAEGRLYVRASRV